MKTFCVHVFFRLSLVSCPNYVNVLLYYVLLTDAASATLEIREGKVYLNGALADNICIPQGLVLGKAIAGRVVERVLPNGKRFTSFVCANPEDRVRVDKDMDSRGTRASAGVASGALEEEEALLANSLIKGGRITDQSLDMQGSQIIHPTTAYMPDLRTFADGTAVVCRPQVGKKGESIRQGVQMSEPQDSSENAFAGSSADWSAKFETLGDNSHFGNDKKIDFGKRESGEGQESSGQLVFQGQGTKLERKMTSGNTRYKMEEGGHDSSRAFSYSARSDPRDNLKDDNRNTIGSGGSRKDDTRNAGGSIGSSSERSCSRYVGDGQFQQFTQLTSDYESGGNSYNLKNYLRESDNNGPRSYHPTSSGYERMDRPQYGASAASHYSSSTSGIGGLSIGGDDSSVQGLQGNFSRASSTYSMRNASFASPQGRSAKTSLKSLLPGLDAWHGASKNI